MDAAIVDPVDEWANQAHRLTAVDPKSYGRRIVLLALVGAAILHSVWVIAAAATAAFVMLGAWLEDWKPMMAAFASATLSGYWLWVLLSPVRYDYGVRLSRATAPALLDLIAKIAGQLGAPTPTHVFLVPDFNAWVQIRSRASGEWRLSIGLPLMMACSEAQLSAVLGHELGHFVAGTAGARLVWAQQANWQNTHERLGHTLLGGLVRRSFNAWGLRFQAESVAMARNHERASDAAGAKVAGAEAAAQALIGMELLERSLSERFWPEIWARCIDGPPPRDVFTDLRHFLEATRQEDYDLYYRSALAEPTLAFDVHPSLSDRVQALKVKPSLPAPPSPSAAVKLLGDKLPELAADMGHWWVAQVRVGWEECGQELKELLKRVAADGHRVPTELHPFDAWQVARALRHTHRAGEAVPFYRRAVALGTGGGAQIGLGLALLEIGDPRGLVELRMGLQSTGNRDEDIGAAYTATRSFLEARGERAEKNPFTRDYHRLRLKTGRRNALGDWARHSIF